MHVDVESLASLSFVDTDPAPTDQNYIIFNLHYKKLKLQFRIEIGLESSNFASEVIRSKEGRWYFKIAPVAIYCYCFP